MRKMIEGGPKNSGDVVERKGERATETNERTSKVPDVRRRQE